MICRYLDPIFLAMNYEPNEKKLFIQCWVDFIGFLNEIIIVEKKMLGGINTLLKFKCVSELLDHFKTKFYEKNHFLGCRDPAIRNYLIRSRDTIPQLFNRFEYEECDINYSSISENSTDLTISKNQKLVPETLEIWNNFLISCQSCENKSDTLLISIDTNGSTDETGFFNDILHISSIKETNCIDFIKKINLEHYIESLSLVEFKDKLDFITYIHYLQSFPDPDRLRTPTEISDKFWKNLGETGIFTDTHEINYKLRLIETLTRLYYSVDYNSINAHPLRGEFINTPGGRFRLWSAYVYRERRRRSNEASRILFIKPQNNLIVIDFVYSFH